MNARENSIQPVKLELCAISYNRLLSHFRLVLKFNLKSITMGV